MALGSGATGSGSAAAINAGNAQVTMSVKDDVSANLRHLQSEFKKLGAEAKKAGKEAKGKESFGGFREFTSGAIAGFGLGILATGVSEIGKAFKDMIPGVESIEKLTEAMQTQTEKIAENLKLMHRGFSEMREDANPWADQSKLTQKEIDATKEQIKLLKDRKAMHDQDVKNLKDMFSVEHAGSALRNTPLWLAKQVGLSPSSGDLIKLDEDKSKAVQAQIKTEEDKIHELERQIKKIKAEPAIKMFGDLAALRKEASDAADAELQNLTPLERKYKEIERALRDYRGANRGGLEAELAMAKAEVEWTKNAQKKFDVLKQIDELTKQAEGTADPQLEGVTELQRKMQEINKLAQDAGVNKAMQDRLAMLAHEVRLADERQKQLQADKTFASEMKDAKFADLTKGMSAEDARLARLVEQGLSNDQIMELSRLRNAANKPNKDILSSSSLTSSDLARSIGAGDTFRTLEQNTKLTADNLNQIRGLLSTLNNNLKIK